MKALPATRTSLLIALAACLPVAVAAEPSLTAQRLGPDQFELVLTTDQTADVGQAQRAIWPAAQQLCAGKTPRLGHYKFQSTEPMAGKTDRPGITLRQQVHCEVAQAPGPAAPAAAVAHDDAKIEQLTKKYLSAKDAGQYTDAYNLFGPSMKASTSLESWSENARNVKAKAGKLISRRVKKITWYDNPPSAPAPGIYAAADYESEFEGMHVHCGYVAWLAQADGTFLMVREEENFIEKPAAGKMPPEQVRAFAQRFGCEVR
jgi:hypothetical protein